MTLNKILGRIGTALAVLLTAGAAQAGTLYIATLSAANEVPPTAAPFSGTGFLILNDAETSATITATHNINIPLTGGHIHRGTAAVNGPIIFPFPNPASPVLPLLWSIPAADLLNLKNLGLYVNFHTTANPTGAIRGTLVRSVLATSATTAGQTSIANALDVSAGLHPELDQILISQAVASSSERAQALGELSGRTIFTQARQALETMAGFEDSLFAHAESTANSAFEGFSGFALGGAAFGKRDTLADQAGAATSRPYLLAGVAYAAASGYGAGVAIGYADGEDKFRNGGGKTGAKTTATEAYVVFEADRVVATAVAGYGWSSYDTTRTLASIGRAARSSHDGRVWSLGAKVAVPIALDNDASAAPYALIDMQRAKIDAYTETGAGVAGLVVPARSAKDTAVEAGAGLTVPMGADALLIARVEAGWRYRLESGRDAFATSLVGSPVAFQTYVLSPGRSAAHAAASLSTAFNDTLSASVGYQGTVTSRTSIHALEARLTLRM